MGLAAIAHRKGKRRRYPIVEFESVQPTKMLVDNLRTLLADVGRIRQFGEHFAHRDQHLIDQLLRFVYLAHVFAKLLEHGAFRLGLAIDHPYVAE